jgi:hypothetical protein
MSLGSRCLGEKGAAVLRPYKKFANTIPEP